VTAPASPRQAGQLYRETMDQAVYAEQLGFDSVWLSEHHFTDEG
jgi:alkanesulfonate monooxygenase SsuD/methylene tetrahydromethanopterin reductase-like flavin-dependent oxidoreductase (luciferase family)